MKKLTFGSILVIVALLLSSCQLHTGLGSLLSGNKPSTNATPGKHVKATHTPPSPKSPSATATPVSSNDAMSITGADFQSNALVVKVGTGVSWANNDSAAHTVTSGTSGVFASGPINQGMTY
jgi:plastocyanin